MRTGHEINIKYGVRIGSLADEKLSYYLIYYYIKINKTKILNVRQNLLAQRFNTCQKVRKNY